MTYERTRTATRPQRRKIPIPVAVGIAAGAVALGYHLSSASFASATRNIRPRAIAAMAAEQIGDLRAHRPRRPGPPPPLRGGHRDADGRVQGSAARGITVVDRGVPAVANLDPDMRRALGRAARDAARSGVTIYINSGWRSQKRQQQLLDRAVLKYGSQEAAVRWVATVKTSSHVSGDAVDIGPPSAIAWLSRNGAEYGLCQIYRNEPWHYELRPGAARAGCPPQYPDPTHDPRMQQ